MLPKIKRRERSVSRTLLTSLVCATHIIDHVAKSMQGDDCRWERTVLGHTFSMSRSSCLDPNSAGAKSVADTLRSWLHTHEETQVMLASILVVVGLWWLVRTLLALLINLLCPVLVVLLAVVCVPQLREPLLGQNYPQLAKLLRNILLKLAESFQS